jgi:exosortase K
VRCAIDIGVPLVADLVQHRRPALLWWSLALGIAATLKWYYSVAAVTRLGWMLEPITLLLRLLTGWHFRANAEGEWQSFDAGIVLVKACAGINFMIMSLLGWCWLICPRERILKRTALLIEWPLLLIGALVFAWLTALIVNTLRIIAVVHLQPSLEHWLAPAAAHRLLGLMIYLPALSAQLLLSEWRRRDRALLVVCAIYAGVMLMVPLLTGNALSNPALYGEHALLLLCILIPVALTAIVPRR